MTTLHIPTLAEVQADALAGRPLDLRRPRKRLGEYLIEAKLLTTAQLDEVLDRQRQWHSRLGDIILASRLMSALQFYMVLSHHYGLNFVNLQEHHPDATLFNPLHIQDYLSHLAGYS